MRIFVQNCQPERFCFLHPSTVPCLPPVSFPHSSTQKSAELHNIGCPHLVSVLPVRGQDRSFPNGMRQSRGNSSTTPLSGCAAIPPRTTAGSDTAKTSSSRFRAARKSILIPIPYAEECQANLVFVCRNLNISRSFSILFTRNSPVSFR